MILDSKLFQPDSGLDSSSFLGEIVNSLKKDDPLCPITVVGPSTYANLSLRQNLGGNGFANVRFIVLPRLSELLGASLLASQARSPLTPILESAAVRGVASGARGVLHDLRNHPATHASLKSTFRELRHLSTTALDRLGDQGELRNEVVRLYRQFRQTTSELYDREDLAQSAATAVRSGDASGLEDLGFILFYQVRNITPAEREMIEALGKNKLGAIFLGLTGDDEADAPTKVLFNGFSETLDAFLGQSDSTIEADTKLVIAPDPHQEIRQVVRSIIKKAETGIPFHRMAIVYRQRDPYARLVKEELEMAGLPVAGPNPDTFSDTAVGRTLTRLMELAEQGDLPRDTVMAWLADCPVRPPGIPKGQYSPSLWDTVSKKAGVVRGLDQWTERLTQFAISSMRSAARAELLGDISEEQAAQVRSEAEVARHVLEFVQDLGDHVPPPHDGSSWGDFVRWADGLLNRYLFAEADLPDSELSSLLGIKDKLGEMAAIDYLQPRPTQRVFREAVCEALQAGLGHMGATGKGVFVAPFGSVATMSFDTVYLVGMIEGAVPPPTSDDPLVPDRNRREAEGSSAGLTLQEERKADERFAYLAALATAPNRVLSFPKADTAAQRGFYPSRWFLEQASSLAGEPVYTSTIWSLADKPWLTVIPSFEGGLMVAEEQSLADPYDYKLARLWSWRQAGLRVADHPLAKSEPLRRALTLGRLRNMGRVTEWDGDVSAASTKSNRLSSVSAPIHSSSSLERWARCPFSYYLGNVLGLSAVERPEEILSITALNKGVLIHDILETFFNTVLQKGSVPRPGEDWTDGHLEALIRIAEEAFTEAQVTGQTGKRLLWEMEKADIVADLEAFLVEDSRLRERFNVTPQSVEARFGFGEDSWEASEVELSDGRTVRFRGMIDRVDIDESGRRALVTDYKTGSITPYSGLNQDPLDGGRKLQLPVYSLATRQQMGNDVVVSAAYWFISSRSKFGLRPAAPVEIDDVSDRFKDVVAEITKGIGSGMFPANPGPRSYFGGFENCAFCEFDRICPTRRDVVWERKSADPRLAGYLGISESGEPEI